MSDSHWTPARIAQLRDYWSQGLSLTGIARAMGDLNRNQVVGKAHRLNLPKRPSPLAAEGRVWYRNQQGMVGSAKVQPLPPEDDLGGSPIAFVAVEATIATPRPGSAKRGGAVARMAGLLKTPKDIVVPPKQAVAAPAPAAVPESRPAAPRKLPEQNIEALFAGSAIRSGDSIHFEGAALAVDGLRGAVCRWPIGDPRDGGFHFCGKKARIKSPYCEDHFKLAYTASSAKSRSRAA